MTNSSGVKHTRWTGERISAVTLGVTLAFGSFLYFTASQYLDAKARALGLAGDPGQATLQQTMAIGASLVFGSWLFVTLVAAAVMALWRAVEIYEYFTQPSPPPQTKPNTVRGKIARFFVLAEWLFMRPFAILFSGYVMIAAGAFAGERDAKELKAAVNDKCTECLIYCGADGKAVMGRAALQAEKTVFVLDRHGLVTFDMESSEIRLRPDIKLGTHLPANICSRPRLQPFAAVEAQGSRNLIAVRPAQQVEVEG